MSSSKQLNARVRMKRDSATNWTTYDPVLENGEIIVVDTSSGEVRFKVGDGTKKYSQLPFSDEVVRNLIASANSEIDTKVSFSESQNITDAQKTVARDNIGASGVVFREW